MRSIRGRSGGDLGRRSGGDIGSIHGRCRVDLGSIWSGAHQGPIRGHSVVDLGSVRGRFAIRGRSGAIPCRSGVDQGSIRGLLGIDLGPIKGCFGVNLRLTWGPPGVDPGSMGRPEVALGRHWVDPGSIWGRIGMGSAAIGVGSARSLGGDPWSFWGRSPGSDQQGPIWGLSGVVPVREEMRPLFDGDEIADLDDPMTTVWALEEHEHHTQEKTHLGPRTSVPTRAFICRQVAGGRSLDKKLKSGDRRAPVGALDERRLRSSETARCVAGRPSTRLANMCCQVRTPTFTTTLRVMRTSGEGGPLGIEDDG